MYIQPNDIIVGLEYYYKR